MTKEKRIKIKENRKNVKQNNKGSNYERGIICTGVRKGYKFVAKTPHACVWDESYILLDIYIDQIYNLYIKI